MSFFMNIKKYFPKTKYIDIFVYHDKYKDTKFIIIKNSYEQIYETVDFCFAKFINKPGLPEFSLFIRENESILTQIEYKYRIDFYDFYSCI